MVWCLLSVKGCHASGGGFLMRILAKVPQSDEAGCGLKTDGTASPEVAAIRHLLRSDIGIAIVTGMCMSRHYPT